jgi:hypothetical protein
MAIAWGPTEDRHDNLGPEPPDDPDDILEDGISGPVLPCLINSLGIAEVVRPGEILPGSVQSTRGQELFGANQPERLTQFRADQVLSALAPVEREIGRFRTHAAHQDGEELGVLIVGVRPDHENALVMPQHSELLIEPDRPAR